ncbi:hypothetical protein V8G54_001684 [Vigna mungo]|uniref:Uncharacterized protein n=1 Tax=Vigna mungo TaxID=3915 RepID=A0AAQ3P8R7_VIGMU
MNVMIRIYNLTNQLLDLIQITVIYKTFHEKIDHNIRAKEVKHHTHLLHFCKKLNNFTSFLLPDQPHQLRTITPGVRSNILSTHLRPHFLTILKTPLCVQPMKQSVKSNGIRIHTLLLHLLKNRQCRIKGTLFTKSLNESVVRHQIRLN